MQFPFRKIKNIFTNQAGFTMLELLVSAAILMVIMGYVVANIRGVGTNDLNLMTQQLISDIRSTQTKGLAGQLTGICALPGAWICKPLVGSLPLGPCAAFPNGLCPDGYICFYLFNEQGPGFPIFCQEGGDCEECQQQFPAGGYSLAIRNCANDQYFKTHCSYTLGADVYPDNQINIQERYLSDNSIIPLGNSYVSNIYYTNNPTLPEIFSGWDAVSDDFANIIFNQGKINISFDKYVGYSIQPDLSFSPDISFLGIELANDKNPDKNYIYISTKTGLISSGQIK